MFSSNRKLTWSKKEWDMYFKEMAQEMMFERRMRNGRIRENNKWAQKFQLEQLDKSFFFHMTWATITKLYEGYSLETSENLYKNDYGELYFAKITKEKCVAIVNANNKVAFNYDKLNDKSLPFTDLSRLQLDPTPINSRYYKLFDLHEHEAHLRKRPLYNDANSDGGNFGERNITLSAMNINLCKGGGFDPRKQKQKNKEKNERRISQGSNQSITDQGKSCSAFLFLI